MKTIRISKSRITNEVFNSLKAIITISNETYFAFDITGSPNQIKSIYDIIDPIQSRNPFIK
jgi:hypothetical protein